MTDWLNYDSGPDIEAEARMAESGLKESRDLLHRIVAAFDADRAGHDMRCLPELVAAIADAREVVR